MELFNFIATFFLSKKISMLTAFVCWESGRTRAACRAAEQAGLRLRVFPALNLNPIRPPQGPGGTPREGVLLDLACPGAAVLLHYASYRRAFTPRHSWLLLHDSPNSSTVAAILAGVDILPDADVTWFAPRGHAADVYRVKTGQPLVLTPLHMNITGALTDLESMWGRWPSLVSRRKHLNNVYFDSVTLITRPEIFKGWSDLRNRQVDTYPKMAYPIWMLLAEDLQIRLNQRQVDLYGEAHNGSFGGAAGELQRGRAELALTTMFMRADRLRVLHFAAETLQIKGPFVFHQPPKSAVSNIFVLPLSRGVWAATGGVLLLAALLLAAASCTLRAAHTDLRRLSVAECFTFTLGTICQQGSHSVPGAVPVRVVMVSALVYSLFLFTAYSAKIVVLLQTPSDAIRTIDELTRSPLALAVQDTTYKRVYFEESVEPATQRLYRRKLLPLGERAYLDVAEGVARVRSGLFAFQIEESAGYETISKTFTEQEKCGLQEVQAIRLPMLAFPIRKHSGLREHVATRLRWQREVGLLMKWRRHWLTARPRCDAGSGGLVSVGLADVRPALQALAAGAGAALLLLIAETTLHAVRTRSSAQILHLDDIPYVN